jgi:restriction endonuclease S subunit
VRLSDVCVKITDGTHQPPPFATDGIPFLFVRNIVAGRLDFETENFISEATFRDLTRSWRASRGDVLYSAVGSYGVAVPVETDRPFAFQRHIALLRPRPDQLDAHFLAHFLNSPEGRALSEVSAAGGAQKTVALGSLSSFALPLPPLSEQKRIAAVLREQLAAAARMRAAAQVQSKVVGQLRPARVAQLQADSRGATWRNVRLGDIATQVQNGVYKPSEFYTSGFALLRMYNLRNDEPSLDLSELACVTLDDDEYSRFRLRAGDLLISRVNSFERVGKCALVGPEAADCVFENMLLRVRFDDSVVPAFVAEQMMTRGVQDWIRGVARRAIGQSSINSRDVRAIPLVMPSLQAQEAFVALLNDGADSVSRARAADLRQADAMSALPSALLRRAFLRGPSWLG